MPDFGLEIGNSCNCGRNLWIVGYKFVITSRAKRMFIDKMIMRELKMRMQNLSMTWIDYKNAYDMVPHTWIIYCLKTVEINEKIQRLLAESMQHGE